MAGRTPGNWTLAQTGYGYNPGIRRGIRIGSARDGSVKYLDSRRLSVSLRRRVEPGRRRDGRCSRQRVRRGFSYGREKVHPDPRAESDSCAALTRDPTILQALPGMDGVGGETMRLTQLVPSALVLFISAPSFAQESIEFSSRADRFTCNFPVRPRSRRPPTGRNMAPICRRACIAPRKARAAIP